MKAFFKSYKENKIKMKEFYDSVERENAQTGSILVTAILGILIAMLTINFFMVFVYMPYLAYFVSALAFLWIVLIKQISYAEALKSIKKPEGFSVYKPLMIDFLFVSIITVIVVGVFALISIPIWFL